jgi:hypothetical protein
MDDLVDQGVPDMICVCATPPAAVMHARYLCKRLDDRIANVQLVVGLWNAQGDLDKARQRIGCDAVVVATLAGAQEQAHLMSQPRSLTSAATGEPAHSEMSLVR